MKKQEKEAVKRAKARRKAVQNEYLNSQLAAAPYEKSSIILPDNPVILPAHLFTGKHKNCLLYTSEMFELAKKEFLNENGTLNGDTTKRESVYNNLYRKMDKDDRLSAGWTMEQYEHQYRQAFAEAAKAADPTWKAGKPIPAGALDGITRESAESGRKSVDIKLSLIHI